MNSFDIAGRVAVVTGGYGVLGGSIARGLAAAGARVAIVGRRREPGQQLADSIRESGAEAMFVVGDVLDANDSRRACDELMAAWGRIDILVNAAGGNVARARSDSTSVFDVPLDAFDDVLRLNLHGTVIPTMAFGAAMCRHDAGQGSIVNISSMAALQAVTGAMGYSIAKAGVDNFTRWLAVDLARRYGDRIRVNAIAPGFFISTQNRAVLLHDDGTHTERARTILRETPMGRFGRPDELLGAVHWLASDASSFALGVQWHPEWNYADNPDSMKLFAAFGEACRSYAAGIRRAA